MSKRVKMGYLETCLWIRMLFRYRVVAGCTPGMASADSLNSKPSTLCRAPFTNCLNHVIGTCRRVAAM